MIFYTVHTSNKYNYLKPVKDNYGQHQQKSA